MNLGRLLNAVEPFIGSTDFLGPSSLFRNLDLKQRKENGITRTQKGRPRSEKTPRELLSQSNESQPRSLSLGSSFLWLSLSSSPMEMARSPTVSVLAGEKKRERFFDVDGSRGRENLGFSLIIRKKTEDLRGGRV